MHLNQARLDMFQEIPRHVETELPPVSPLNDSREFHCIYELEKRVEGYDIMKVASLIDVTQRKIEQNCQHIINIGTRTPLHSGEFQRVLETVVEENRQLSQKILPFLYEKIECLDA